MSETLKSILADGAVPYIQDFKEIVKDKVNQIMEAEVSEDEIIDLINKDSEFTEREKRQFAKDFKTENVTISQLFLPVIEALNQKYGAENVSDEIFKKEFPTEELFEVVNVNFVENQKKTVEYITELLVELLSENEELTIETKEQILTDVLQDFSKEAQETYNESVLGMNKIDYAQSKENYQCILPESTAIALFKEKTKQKVTDPRNTLNEDGSISIYHTNNNEIKIFKKPLVFNQVAIDIPEEIINFKTSEQGIAPINREHDHLLDVIGSLIIFSNPELNPIENINDFMLLRETAPYRIDENTLTSFFFETKRPTQQQKDHVRKVFEDALKTTLTLNYTEEAKAFLKNKLPKGTDIKSYMNENEIYTKTTGTIISGKIHETEDNSKRRYDITEFPFLLNPSIFGGQVQTLNRNYLVLPESGGRRTRKDNNYNILNKEIARRIAEGETAISKGKDVPAYSLAVNIQNLFESTGVKVTKQKRNLLLKKLVKQWNEKIKNDESIIYCNELTLYPKINGKPNTKILIAYQDENEEWYMSDEFLELQRRILKEKR